MMEEQFFMYLISLCFLFSCYKGYKNGISAEVVSIAFFFVAVISSVLFYDEPLLNRLLSGVSFAFFYFIGLFFSFVIRKKTLKERILGIFVGGIKFAIYLLFFNALIYALNSNILPYEENSIIRAIQPTSKKLATILEYHLWERKKNNNLDLEITSNKLDLAITSNKEAETTDLEDKINTETTEQNTEGLSEEIQSESAQINEEENN